LDTQLQAAVLLLEWLVREPLTDGRLLELLPELPRPSWPLYLYRPSRNVTPQRVKVVGDVLAQVVSERLAKAT